MNPCLEPIILPVNVARTVSIGECRRITTAYEALTSILGVLHTRCGLVTT